VLIESSPGHHWKSWLIVIVATSIAGMCTTMATGAGTRIVARAGTPTVVSGFSRTFPHVTRAGQERATSPPPLVKEHATIKISDHVYAIPDANVPLVPNIGIIVGRRATLVVDTGLGPRNGEAVLREVAKVRRGRELYVATTHYHPEHSLGGAAFPATAKFVRPKMQQQDMEELGKEIQNTFASRSPLHRELLKDVDYPRADILFDREQPLDLGGVHVSLFWRGPMHTRGDTLIFVDEDKVLFSGDVVMNRTFLAAGPASNIKTWLATLAELDGLHATVVVPSHGAIGDASLIGRDRDYLRAVQLLVTELKAQGKSADDSAQAVTMEIQARFSDWAAPMRIGAAARAAYAEIQ
jgi:glyoxylase-like metal-dependent hydrolase (beta-lactamase superfamily II)